MVDENGADLLYCLTCLIIDSCATISDLGCLKVTVLLYSFSQPSELKEVVSSILRGLEPFLSDGISL
jgi:hypothetical protein